MREKKNQVGWGGAGGDRGRNRLKMLMMKKRTKRSKKRERKAATYHSRGGRPAHRDTLRARRWEQVEDWMHWSC